CSRLRLLFCYYHLIRRQLRSFPTRRSSDLTCHCSPSSSSHASSTPGRLRGERRPDGRSSRAGLPSRSCASAAGPPTVAGTLGSTDRKSTRLNSSHVKISYAVFCLKKKKSQQ